MAIDTCQDTLLRLIRVLPLPSSALVPHPGVDESAVRRGRTYATILTGIALAQDGLGAAGPAVVHTLRRLTRRVQYLDAEIKDALEQTTGLVQQAVPALLQLQGIGPDPAAALLGAAGDNPDRQRSEASFAACAGPAPHKASSGKVGRRRLDRGGNRQANAALFRAVLSRLRWDSATQEYLKRRTAGGLSKREIIRCLKHYLARTVYKILRASFPLPTATCHPQGHRTRPAARARGVGHHAHRHPRGRPPLQAPASPRALVGLVYLRRHDTLARIVADPAGKLL